MGSQLNLIAAMLYCLVAVLCLRADRSCLARSGAWNLPLWIAIALFFFGFMLWRLIDGEHLLHHLLVDGHAHSRFYADRRWIQGPAVLLGGICGLWLLIRENLRHKGDPWCRVGWSATLALLTLTGLRMISWHDMDMILFAALGPIHLNHVLDIGLTAIVGWSALQCHSQQSADGLQSRDVWPSDTPQTIEMHDAQ